MKTILITPRVLIRQFAEDEIDLLLTMNADERIARFITRRTVDETHELFKQMLIDYQTTPQFGRWALFNLEDSDFIGLCMLLQARPGLSGTEIGYSLNYKYWNQGIATEVVNAVTHYGLNTLGLPEICAITNAENTASQKVLSKAGYVSSGNVFIHDSHLPLYTIKKDGL